MDWLQDMNHILDFLEFALCLFNSTSFVLDLLVLFTEANELREVKVQSVPYLLVDLEHRVAPWKYFFYDVAYITFLDLVFIAHILPQTLIATCITRYVFLFYQLNALAKTWYLTSVALLRFVLSIRI